MPRAPDNPPIVTAMYDLVFGAELDDGDEPVVEMPGPPDGRPPTD